MRTRKKQKNSLAKGADIMKRKSQMIQQGKVTELMTQLANLPEREKSPNDPVSLSAIFHTKEYIAEVKAALKKGYTFETLAKIFTERCGVAVSARQIKYHFTRAKNQGVKSKSGKKSGEIVDPGNNALSMDSTVKAAAEGVKENSIAPSSQTKASLNVSGFSFESRATVETDVNIDCGASFRDMWPK
jgi:hypothetical protein